MLIYLYKFASYTFKKGTEVNHWHPKVSIYLSIYTYIYIIECGETSVELEAWNFCEIYKNIALFDL